MLSLKLIESIIRLTWLALGVILTLFVILLYNNTNALEEPQGKEVAILTLDVGEKLNEKGAKFDKGKGLFKNNCATCHNKNMKDNLTGPALAGVTERWGEYPKSDLYNWIKNSQKLIKDKHPRALEVGKEWGFEVMNAFPNLTEEDIEAILLYIER